MPSILRQINEYWNHCWNEMGGQLCEHISPPLPPKTLNKLNPKILSLQLILDLLDNSILIHPLFGEFLSKAYDNYHFLGDIRWRAEASIECSETHAWHEWWYKDSTRSDENCQVCFICINSFGNLTLIMMMMIIMILENIV